MPQSPAEDAGLRRGDIVVEVGGEPIVSTKALRALILARAPGRALDVTVVRDDRTETVELVPASVQGAGGLAIEAQAEWAGAAFVDASDDVRGFFGIAEAGGAVIASLDPRGNAARMGLVPGDVVRRVGRFDVTGVADLNRAVEQTSTATVVVFERAGERSYAVLSPQIGSGGPSPR